MAERERDDEKYVEVTPETILSEIEKRDREGVTWEQEKAAEKTPIVTMADLKDPARTLPLEDIPRREVEIRADFKVTYNAVEFFLRGFVMRRMGVTAAYPAPIILTEDETHGAYDPEPTFSTTPENATMLMDDLWRAGIRPSDRRDISGVIAAKDETIAALLNLLKEANTVSHENRNLLGSALETISQIALRQEFEEEEEEDEQPPGYGIVHN
ncbi:MAG: hypothetical protein KAU31_11845 [Spirochaetaceae bacterium]|nr:hypothetical protein [Spirochaetaceae bacterium]